MQVIDILPTQLGVSFCPFHDEVKSLIIEEIDNNTQTYGRDSVGHLDAYSPLHHTKFDKFRSWIEEQATIYTGLDHLMVTDSWVNICHEGGYQHPHFHSNSYVCSLYYVSFDGDTHSPTYFHAPTNDMKFPDHNSLMLTNEKETKYNQPNEVVGIEGSLILWPSYIAHGYRMNNYINRVTISTNIMPTNVGSFGVVPLTLEERDKQNSASRSGNLWDNPQFI